MTSAQHTTDEIESSYSGSPGRALCEAILVLFNCEGLDALTCLAKELLANQRINLGSLLAHGRAFARPKSSRSEQVVDQAPVEASIVRPAEQPRSACLVRSMRMYLLSGPMLYRSESVEVDRSGEATHRSLEIAAVDPLERDLLKVLADSLCLYAAYRSLRATSRDSTCRT